ncbi:MAG: c-type cytochrome, partial [Verrucomicrobiaceae bacterium]
TGAPLTALIKDPTPEVAENLVLLAHRHPAYFGAAAKEVISRAAQAGGLRARLLALLTTRPPAEEIDATVATLAGAGGELDDPWLQQAVLTHLDGHTGRFAEALLRGGFSTAASDARTAFIRNLTAMSAANTDRGDLGYVLASLRTAPGELLWWKAAILEGLAQGLPRSGVPSLPDFVAHPPLPDGGDDVRAEIPRLLERAGRIITDTSLPDDLRVASLPLLSQQPYETALPVLRELLSGRQSAAISQAAFAIVSHHGARRTASLLYEILPTAHPAQRQGIITLLANDGATLADLLRRMDRGEVPKALVDAETRWHLLQSVDPVIKPLAEKLFERPAEDRAAVISAYMGAATAKGDPAKGRELYTVLCSVCHTWQGQGTAVGPDISDVRARDKRALINDILDPNRMVEARW